MESLRSRVAGAASRTLEALVRGGFEAAVRVTARASLMIKLARGEVSVTQSWLDLETDAYVARDGRMAVYSSRAPEPWAEIAGALRGFEALEKSPLYAPLPEPTGKPVSSVDGRVAEAALTGDAGFVVEDLELDQIGDAAGMVLLEYWATALQTSTGADLAYEGTRFNGYVRVFRGIASSGQWSWTSTRYDLAAAKRAIGQAKELAAECSRLPRVRVEPGEYRVLLGPMVVGNLAEIVASSASAGAILFGFSFLSSKKPGDRVASEKLTLEDRPLDTGLPAFRGFDDEGVATRDKAIIRRGVLETILHNTKTARAMGGETTGNAGWIMPSPFNIHVGPGTLRPDEMLEALGDGIYVSNNWYTRFQNYVEGEFSTVSRDAVFLVRGGRPVGCLDRIRIADVLPRLMSSVEDLSAERWPIQWWEVDRPVLAPFALLGSARVSVAEV
ncbi:MAG: TldD/PmbA family protein [Desulfurococcales archaeon]|nr:TldD/PmbA family protein [Desulfurococcales archaeon]